MESLYSLSNKELLRKAQERMETAVHMTELARAELITVCEPQISSSHNHNLQAEDNTLKKETHGEEKLTEK